MLILQITCIQKNETKWWRRAQEGIGKLNFPLIAHLPPKHWIFVAIFHFHLYYDRKSENPLFYNQPILL